MALNKSGFGAGTKGGVRSQFGVVSSTPPSTPGLFELLAPRQGFPKLSQRAGLGSPTPGNPCSLQTGVMSGRGRGSEAPAGSSGGSLASAPSSGLPLSRDCIPGLPSVGLARSQLSSRLDRALVGLGRQPGRLLLPWEATNTCPPSPAVPLGPRTRLGFHSGVQVGDGEV